MKNPVVSAEKGMYVFEIGRSERASLWDWIGNVFLLILPHHYVGKFPSFVWLGVVVNGIEVSCLSPRISKQQF